MSARDEFPLQRLTFHSPHGIETVATCPDYAAMCDRIDTLTARYLDSLGHGERLAAELRSLRAAVAQLWQANEAVDVGAYNMAFDALMALGPSDGSWEPKV